MFVRNRLLLLLCTISLLLYLADYLVLGNTRDLLSSFLGNLAFLPVYVMFVTLMVEQVVRERERQAVMRKLNMVIGVFFSEVGNGLLREISRYLAGAPEFKDRLRATAGWKEADFAAAQKYLSTSELSVSCSAADKLRLKEFLVGKRSFLVGLLENQNLLEHEQFTDLLWAVFHLVEELEARHTFDGMHQSDIEHLNGDIRRVAGYLSREWISYMQHLKSDYPYLYSLAVRLNPLLDNPDPHVY